MAGCVVMVVGWASIEGYSSLTWRVVVVGLKPGDNTPCFRKQTTKEVKKESDKLCITLADEDGQKEDETHEPV